jgi:transcriptional regulator of arginine metabolism
MTANKILTGSTTPLLTDLKNILLNGVTTTQETICTALEAKGHLVNQSKISRLLRKLNAIKSKDDQGKMVYHLPQDAAPPSINVSLSDLIINMHMNETMIILKTSPGSASLIARIIDNKKCQIIGTIAGDDTVFIAPKSVKKIKESFSLICSFLGIGNN